jgi:Asp-tRNAAsn/Glu-tRNAGln amidotransferase A subunit and related amidases
MNWETFNKATGTTNNPYDTRRTPGGSSGGEVSDILFLFQFGVLEIFINERTYKIHYLV